MYLHVGPQRLEVRPWDHMFSSWTLNGIVYFSGKARFEDGHDALRSHIL